jgi:hypothetical protein
MIDSMWFLKIKHVVFFIGEPFSPIVKHTSC